MILDHNDGLLIPVKKKIHEIYLFPLVFLSQFLHPSLGQSQSVEVSEHWYHEVTADKHEHFLWSMTPGNTTVRISSKKEHGETSLVCHSYSRQLMALLMWNLIEHSLLLYTTENETTLPGWDKKKTRRPTAFMLTTKFMGAQLSELLEYVNLQHRYLTALHLSESDLLGKTSEKLCSNL